MPTHLKVIPTNDSSKTIYNAKLKETYHSINGAVTESIHVYINAGLKYFYNKNINKEINKFDLSLDFSRFKLLQDKIYKIKEGFYTEFVRIFIQLAYIKLITLKRSLSIFNFNDLIKTVEKKYLGSDLTNDKSLSEIQNRFKCVLVDEFQDTDNIQWSIIKKFFYTTKEIIKEILLI